VNIARSGLNRGPSLGASIKTDCRCLFLCLEIAPPEKGRHPGSFFTV
jgi:hypothetical protein